VQRLASAAVLALACAWLPRTVAAEDLGLLGGLTTANDPASGSYAWALEYRQQLQPHLAASFGYLNEGHLPTGHRDGATLQAWADTGPLRDRLSLSLGAGPYFYFDTRDEYNPPGYDNQHGVGVLVTARARYALSPQWFALLEVSQSLGLEHSTRTVLLGAGYSLDSFLATLARAQEDGAPVDVAAAPHELGVFAGETTLNDLSSNKSTDYGVEYRLRAARHLELSTSLLEESNGAFHRHASLTGEAWLVQDFFPQRQFTAGLGLGPYVALSTYQTADGRNAASVVGLASMTLGWRFTRALVLRAIWHRAFTTDDQDRDIITLGLALRF
jgi:hypothetical protein